MNIFKSIRFNQNFIRQIVSIAVKFKVMRESWNSHVFGRKRLAIDRFETVSMEFYSEKKERFTV